MEEMTDLPGEPSTKGEASDSWANRSPANNVESCALKFGIDVCPVLDITGLSVTSLKEVLVESLTLPIPISTVDLSEDSSI